MFRRIRFFIMDKTLNFKRRRQRFKRGYSYSDVWNMCDWFIEVTSPMLTHLRDEGIGVPGELWLEGADNEREKWEVLLTEMIYCLTLMNEEEARNHLEIDDNDYSVESYQKVSNFMEAQKNRFFELFSKYFYHLWD